MNVDKNTLYRKNITNYYKIVIVYDTENLTGEHTDELTSFENILAVVKEMGLEYNNENILIINK